MIAWLRFKIAWIRWTFRYPGYRMGDPALGPAYSELREHNRNILRERWFASEPRREDFK
jgi:hypothetical protein